jgi:hypothetical protein
VTSPTPMCRVSFRINCVRDDDDKDTSLAGRMTSAA